MREPKPEWIAALRRLTGCEQDTIRFNETVWRWEFVLTGADAIPRSQFWGWFNQPADPITGLQPFRELDDDGMREALRNLERTFIGNPWDGLGSTKKEVTRRMKFNEEQKARGYKEAGDAWADMFMERRRRIHAHPMVGWTRASEPQPVRHIERRSAYANAGASEDGQAKEAAGSNQGLEKRAATAA